MIKYLMLISICAMPALNAGILSPELYPEHAKPLKYVPRPVVNNSATEENSVKQTTGKLFNSCKVLIDAAIVVYIVHGICCAYLDSRHPPSRPAYLWHVVSLEAFQSGTLYFAGRVTQLLAKALIIKLMVYSTFYCVTTHPRNYIGDVVGSISSIIRRIFV